MSNLDILRYVERTHLPNFRGVFMRDTLPHSPRQRECGVVNLNTSHQPGSHWVCYFKKGKERIYFDSFGQITPLEIQKYLKTKKEFRGNTMIIQRNTDIVQAPNTSECGHLCLYVLKHLAGGTPFQEIINVLRRNGYT